MSWVVDVLLTFVWILLGGALSFAVLSAIDPLIRLIRRRRGLPITVSYLTPQAPPPSWSLTLLVDVDHEARLFRPSVQLRGSTLQFPPTLRLELVDERGVQRTSCERSLPPWTIGGEVALPEFTAPDGATVEDVLGWCWDLVMEDHRGELGHWREYPAPAGALNAEAELELPGVSGI